MGALALGIVAAVIVVGGLLAVLVRRHIAHVDRRDFASGDSSGPILVSSPDPDSPHAGDFCADAGGDCGGGGGDGGGGGGD